MKTKPGDIFNALIFRQDRERLLKLGYFLDISSPRFSVTHNDKVAVSIQVQEKKTNRIEVGIEQENLEYLGYGQWLINHAFLHSDLISGKIQMGVQENQWKFRSYSLRYVQPWILNRINLSFTGDIWTDLKDEYPSNLLDPNLSLIQTQRVGTSVAFGLPLIPHLLNLSLKYKNENVRGNTSTLIPPYRLSAISAGLGYYNLDNGNNPRKGGYWDLEIEQGGDLGFIDLQGLTFSKSTFRGAFFMPASQKGTIAVALQAGSIYLKNAPSTFENDNFIIGGANSLRGYRETDYRSPFIYPFIGRKKLLLNTEYRYNWTDKFQTILFYDIGKTFNQDWDFNFSTFFSSVGTGIRYSTPIGSIRLDGALGRDHYFIHLGLGQVF